MWARCKDCCFYDICSDRRYCSNYAPVGEQAENAYIDHIVERERKVFRDEWYEYISQYKD